MLTLYMIYVKMFDKKMLQEPCSGKEPYMTKNSTIDTTSLFAAGSYDYASVRFFAGAFYRVAKPILSE